MTRTSAKQILADTWVFKQVDDTVALREVALIQAVQDHGERWRLQPKFPRRLAQTVRVIEDTYSHAAMPSQTSA